MIFTHKVPVRYIQVFLLWIGLIVSIILRINMSVCIVAMTSDKFSTEYGYPIYNWTEPQKSRVLSALFLGYISLQVLIGNLVGKKGAKVMLFIALTMTSACTVVTPFVAEYGYMAVAALRFLEGFAQSGLVPSITVHISRWVPPSERVELLSLCFSGTAVAPLIGFPLCGYLAASSGGWPSVFYVTGGFGFVWAILWLWISANSPAEHKSISEAERTYIETGLQQDMSTAKKRKTPWKGILTSIPVYAVVIVSICESWGFWTLLTEMPNYLSAALDLDMKDNGLLSSLPYLSAYITSMLYSGIASYIRNHYKISKTLHRNIWNSIAMWGSSAVLFILSLMNRPSTFTAVLLLMVTVSLLTAKYNGYVTNPIELSPNFCGTIVAIANSAGTLGPFFGPLCVGWLVDDPTSQEQWNVVFRVCSVIMVAGNLIYVIFSSSEVQPWNNSELSVKFSKELGSVEVVDTMTKL